MKFRTESRMLLDSMGYSLYSFYFEEMELKQMSFLPSGGS
jgi:hypothetical protein